MAHKLTALVVAALLWCLTATAVLIIVWQTNELWNAQAGFALVAATVGGAWAGTELVLTRLGFEPPYRPR